MAAVQARQDSQRSAELGKRAGGMLLQGMQGDVTFPQILKQLEHKGTHWQSGHLWHPWRESPSSDVSPPTSCHVVPGTLWHSVFDQRLWRSGLERRRG